MDKPHYLAIFTFAESPAWLKIDKMRSGGSIKSAPATVRFFVRDPAPLSHSTGPPASKRQRAAMALFDVAQA
ncbi:hypothetical protein NUITMVR1_30090 [Raoultella ornithinolytica]|nr:hypothetical protein NUITMVR1_30090 [Raoultella ornithinolytica]